LFPEGFVLRVPGKKETCGRRGENHERTPKSSLPIPKRMTSLSFVFQQREGEGGKKKRKKRSHGEQLNDSPPLKFIFKKKTILFPLRYQK
jgi:hypothetical protein